MQKTFKLINVVSLKVEDAGLYTCLASSLAGEDGRNQWVRVQGDTSGSFVLLEETSHTPPPPPSLNLSYLHLGLDG